MAKKKAKRVPTRVYARDIDRNVARTALKQAGAHHPNKILKDHWRQFSKN